MGEKENLDRLVKATGITQDELANTLSVTTAEDGDVTKDSLAHVLTGARSTKRIWEKLRALFGINRWDGPWSWESILFADKPTYSKILSETSGPSTAKRVASNKVRAHAKMHDSGRYKYVSGEKVSFQGAFAALVRNLAGDPEALLSAVERFNSTEKVYAGGYLQHSFIQLTDAELKNVVLSGHAGEEVFVCLEGRIDFIVQKRTNPIPFIQGRTSAPDGRALKVSIEKTNVDPADKTTPDFVKEVLATLGPVDGKKYECECEVFTLHEGDVLKYLACVPHGAMVNPDYARELRAADQPVRAIGLAVTHGSFLAEGGRTSHA